MKKYFLLGLYTFLFLPANSQELRRIGSMGIGFSAVNDSIIKVNKLKNKNALLVTSIVPGLTGEALKIAKGDIVLSINGIFRLHPQGLALNKSITKFEGDEVEYFVLRNGMEMTLKTKAIARPLETSSDYNVTYDQFPFMNGINRCIITSPKTSGKKPGILIIQGYPCSSIDNIPALNPIMQLSDQLTKRGYVVMRAEKPGIGDSYNSMECYDIDFKTEVASFEAAYLKLKTVADVDTNNLFIFGLSMGGMEAPFIASQVNPKGVIVYGITTKSWHEYLTEMLRFQNPNLGVDYTQIESEMKLYTTLLYDLFVNLKKPSELIKKNPDYLKLLQRDFNYIKDDDFLTRSIIFSQSLNKCDIPKEWSKVSSHVLSAFGEYDIQAINNFGHKEIVEIVNKNHPGKASYMEFAKTEHGMIELLNEKEKWEIHTVPGKMKIVLMRGLNQKFINDVDKWIKAIIEKNYVLPD